MVCGVFRGGEYEALAGEIQKLQLQFCGKNRRCWQEDRGEELCVSAHKKRILSYNVFVVNLPIGDRNRGDAGQGVWPLCLFDLERGWGRRGLCS